jgi:electron transfer flavoprotein-quinone oxidoreductase
MVAPENHTLGAKEVLALDPTVIEDRFGVGPGEGVDIEMIGATGSIPGGGFLYTNADTVSVGVVVSLPDLAEAGIRPERLIAHLKAHPAIAPYIRGGVVKEYSAHLIPEGGYNTMPRLAIDGMLVAGDAAGMCLAAGLWLEGVNFAIGSGLAAGRAVDRAITAGDTTAAGLASYRKDLEAGFVLADHKRLRGAPRLVMSDRVQQCYPAVVCDLAESLFTVTNPEPKPGTLRLARRAARSHGVGMVALLRDGLAGLRVFR